MDQTFSRLASRIAVFAGQPTAFVLALGTVVAWVVTGPIFGFSETWQLVINTGTTIVTFLMVFLIQNSQNRDGAALQAKLDEIVRAIDGARNEFIGIEHLSDREIAAIIAELERETGAARDRTSPPATVERLRERV